LKRYRSPRHVIAEVERLIASAKPSIHPPSVLVRIVELLCSSRHYSSAGIYLVAGGRVALRAASGRRPQREKMALGAGYVGVAAQTGQLTAGSEGGWPQTAVPIKLVGKVLGVLAIQSENVIASQDRVLLKQIAFRVARYLSYGGKYLMRKAREAARPRPSSQSEPARGYQPGSEKPVPAAELARLVAAGEKSRT
jgi:putative methionine-R-sulfoxide reductase with GAF domain